MSSDPPMENVDDDVQDSEDVAASASSSISQFVSSDVSPDISTHTMDTPLTTPFAIESSASDAPSSETPVASALVTPSPPATPTSASTSEPLADTTTTTTATTTTTTTPRPSPPATPKPTEVARTSAPTTPTSIPVGLPVTSAAPNANIPVGIALSPPSPSYASSSISSFLSSSPETKTSTTTIHISEPAATPKAKARTKNTTSRLSGFTLGVTWALQKMGKHEKTVESPEFEATVKVFQANRVGLTDLLKWATEIHKNNRTVAVTNQEFYSALGKLGGANRERAAAETVQTFVPLALDLEVIRQRFDTRLNTLLLEPLRDLVNNQIQNVHRLLSKLDVDRLDMDTKLHQEQEYANKDENDFGKVASHERAAEAKLTYEKTISTILDSCALIESTKKHLLQENLLEFVRAQSEYFDACSHRTASASRRNSMTQSPPASPRVSLTRSALSTSPPQV